MDFKISINKVVDIYTSLCADENSDDGRVFCRTSASLLERWIDPVRLKGDCEYDICYAAAAMANYRRVLKQNTEVSDFKAGDITVNDASSAAVENAKRLYEDAMESIGMFLRSRSFAFVNVKG